jgi:hypothetical protein
LSHSECFDLSIPFLVVCSHNELFEEWYKLS